MVLKQHYMLHLVFMLVIFHLEKLNAVTSHLAFCTQSKVR